jgi:hypothetical protein
MIWVNGEKNKQPHSWKGKVIPFATAIGGPDIVISISLHSMKIKQY